ncbi:MAG: molybdopterin-dependent oxidoreductase [Actinomycetota bacterium]
MTRTTKPAIWRRRAAGALAGGLALSFLWAANRIEPAVPFPPLSVAERVIRLAPGDLATFFIETLGRNALRLLAIGTIAGFLVLYALLPELTTARGRPHPFFAGAIAAVICGGGAFLGPVQPRPAGVILASIAVGSLYSVSAAWLIGAGETAEPDLTRRRALVSIGTAIAGFVVGGEMLGRVARRLAGPNTDVAIRAPDEPAATPRRSSFPGVPGLSQEITSASDHYVVDIDLLDPVVETDDWFLAVRGLVDTPLDLTFSDLQRRFALVEEYSVLTCISNPVGGDLLGSSSWTGVRLGEVLSATGVREESVDVVFRCADGYSDSLPIEAAFDPSVILAIAQNREPLAQEHGFPCRVRSPAVYGMKNAKWVEAVEVVDRDYKGYWMERGWSDVAIVRTQSRIDVVSPELVAGRPAWVAGVAWAGDRAVSRVEISVDGGRTWAQAMLHPPLSRLAWTRWAYRWTPPEPGRYRILCRATDGKGRLQEAMDRPPHPSGASGYHEVDVGAV